MHKTPLEQVQFIRDLLACINPDDAMAAGVISLIKEQMTTLHTVVRDLQEERQVLSQLTLPQIKHFHDRVNATLSHAVSQEAYNGEFNPPIVYVYRDDSHDWRKCEYLGDLWRANHVFQGTTWYEDSAIDIAGKHDCQVQVLSENGANLGVYEPEDWGIDDD